jgi:integrase
MIGLLIYQGITSKELAQMKVSHIDLDAGTVKVVGQSKNRNRTFKLTVGQEQRRNSSAPRSRAAAPSFPPTSTIRNSNPSSSAASSW